MVPAATSTSVSVPNQIPSGSVSPGAGEHPLPSGDVPSDDDGKSMGVGGGDGLAAMIDEVVDAVSSEVRWGGGATVVAAAMSLVVVAVGPADLPPHPANTRVAVSPAASPKVISPGPGILLDAPEAIVAPPPGSHLYGSVGPLTPGPVEATLRDELVSNLSRVYPRRNG